MGYSEPSFFAVASEFVGKKFQPADNARRTHRQGDGSSRFEMPKPPSWTEQASCLGLPIEQFDALFFPKRTYKDEARKMCNACPVQAPCLQLGMGEPEGMFGGLTPNERSALKLSSAVATPALKLSVGG